MTARPVQNRSTSSADQRTAEQPGLSISNIAWDVALDGQVAELLQEMGVAAIDIAPGKYFPNIAEAAETEIEAVRRTWEQRGIRIVGMQALLFGTTHLNLFADAAVQARMLAHLTSVCRIAKGLGAEKLTFGSPKNRDCSVVPAMAVRRVYTEFFKRLGDIAESFDVAICLEPNPTRYQSNFMTTTLEALAVVRQVNSRGIQLQLDTGALLINGEEPVTILAECASAVGHVHLSEPDLAPLGTSAGPHDRIAAALQATPPSAGYRTIEMLVKDPAPLPVIRSALAFAKATYWAPHSEQSS